MYIQFRMEIEASWCELVPRQSAEFVYFIALSCLGTYTLALVQIYLESQHLLRLPELLVSPKTYVHLLT